MLAVYKLLFNQSVRCYNAISQGAVYRFLTVLRRKYNVIFAIIFNVSLAMPLYHYSLLLKLAGSKEAIFYSAHRGDRAILRLAARGGSLPKLD